jgi:DNA polymerase-3 subunit epsilon
VDQFISLVNPERPIQQFVTSLTGINNEMLRNAPKFYEIAKRVIEITEGCILVAHNAVFDYRVIALEFERLGYTYVRPTICTVELSKKLLPNMPSYSLGKLVRELGIPVVDRHRASGDALATVKLFKLLISKDLNKEIISSSVRLIPKKQVDTKLLEILKELPTETGVYYFHDSEGKIIYIGKSKNIKKRVTQHFTSEARKSKKIQEQVHSVSFEITGSDLIAQLKENEEIKTIKPLFNRALRRNIYLYQLDSFVDEMGYIHLQIEKTNSKKNFITTFTNYQQAKNFLYNVTSQYQLCQKLTGLHSGQSACFAHGIGVCLGACVNQELPDDYNQRVQEVIAKFTLLGKSMLLIDKGTDINNKSVVYIEKGKVIGMGSFNLNFQINNIEILKTMLTPLTDTKDAHRIIKNEMANNKFLKIKTL